ncbi:MAG: oxidoreductase [Streptosporangiales bacterium]|nr:oxidoreductase [Streptosporangiales bacterium]
MSDPLARLAALPGVADAVDEARTAIDRLRAHRVLRLRGGEVSAESALHGARASALLECSDPGYPGDASDAGVSLDRMRAGEVYDPVVQGALRVLGELAGLVETWRRAPRQVLARLHVLAAADRIDADELGRPRPDDQVTDTLGLGEPPPPAEVTARLDALAALLTGRTGAPAPVVAAVVHGELLVLRPFRVYNGLVARAAERLTLVERGLDPRALSCPEVGHLELRGEYVDAVRGYASGEPDGVAVWVRHCCAAVTLGAREASTICEALMRDTRGGHRA